MLTEALLSVVTETVFSHILEQSNVADKVRSRLGPDPQKLAFQVALARAYTTFARNYPQWTASLFDVHFLQNAAAPFLARCLPWSEPPDPAELAAAWVDQIGLAGGVRERRIGEATAAAMDFLRFLRAELRARDEFQQDYDSMALDTVAEASTTIAKSIEVLRADLERTLTQAAKYQVTIQEAKGLVIGDNATVSNVFQTFLDGNYATLQEFYIAPDDVFDRVRVDEFAGRAWLEADLDQFLNTAERGVWLLVGEAGIGKTSFLAHLVRERGYLHFFAEQSPGDVNLSRALQSLAAQLISRFRLEPYNERGTLPQTLSSYPDFLSRLLRAASGKLGAGERVIVVVDALDEAGTMAGGNVLGLPRQLPKGVYVVASQRPQAVTLNIEPRPHRTDLKAAEHHNQNDIGAYLRKVAHTASIARQLGARGYTTDDFVRVLTAKSAGNWMYLHYVVDEIRGGRWAPLDLVALPPGLAGYYAQFWGRWSKRSNWDTVYAPVLTTLAAAQEPISLPTLKRWAAIQTSDYELRRLLKQDWAAFVYEIGDKEPRYRPYHLSLREFLSGSLNVKECIPDVEFLLEELRERSKEAHRRIVTDVQAGGNSNWGSPATDNYAHRYLTTHLRLVGDNEELFHLVDDLSWYEAQMRQDPSGTAFVTDLEQAWSAAEKVDTQAAERQQLIPNLGREVGCALGTTSLRSIANNIPAYLLVALVDAHVWTTDQALAAAHQQLDLAVKVTSFARLLSYVGPDERDFVLAEALDAARLIREGAAKIKVLAEVLSQLEGDTRTGVLREAMDAAKHLSEGQRGHALAALVPYLQGNDRREAVQQGLMIAAGIFRYSESSNRRALLIALAPYTEESKRQAAILEAFRAGSNADYPVLDIVPLVPHLSRALLQAVHSEVQAIDELGVKVTVLAAVAPYLEDIDRQAAIQETLITIRQILKAPADGNEQQQSRDRHFAAVSNALRTLSEFIDENEYRLLVQESLEAIRSFPMDYRPGRVEALTVLGQQLPSNQRDEVLLEALAVAVGVSDREFLVLAQAAFAPYLPPAVLEYIADQLQLINIGWILQGAISAIAPHLPGPTIPKVFAVIQNVEWDWSRSPTLEALAPYVPDTLLADVLETVRTLNDPQRRVQILLALIPNRTEAVRQEIVQEALATAREAHPNWGRAAALAALVPYLPPIDQPSIVREALDLIKQLGEHSDEKGEALVRLAASLPRTFTEEAYQLSRELRNGQLRVKVLVALSKVVSEAQCHTVLQEALDVATAATDPISRVRLVTELLDYVPADSHQYVEDQLHLVMGSPGWERWEAVIAFLPYMAANDRVGYLPDLLNKLTDPGLDGYLKQIVPYLEELPIADLYPLWVTVLRKTALFSRQEFLKILASLVPVIKQLGGSAAPAEVVHIITKVGERWP